MPPLRDEIVIPNEPEIVALIRTLLGPPPFTPWFPSAKEATIGCLR